MLSRQSPGFSEIETNKYYLEIKLHSFQRGTVENKGKNVMKERKVLKILVDQGSIMSLQLVNGWGPKIRGAQDYI